MKKAMSIATAALACLSVKAADLTVSSGTTHTVSSEETYGTVTLAGGTVRLDSSSMKEQTIVSSANSTIQFNGGRLIPSGWNLYWFEPAENTMVTLESVDGKDIYLDVDFQKHYFSRGAGWVETSGAGDVVVRSQTYQGERMYLTFITNRITWGHAGDMRATGTGGLRLEKGGCLPSGTATGGIKLEGTTELYLGSEANTYVNSIEGPVHALGWAYLKFGQYKDGVFRNAPNVGGVSSVQKYGADTTLTIDNTGFRRLTILYGTARATGGASTVLALEMQHGSTFIVDGTTFTATNEATFTRNDNVNIVNGGSLDVVGATDASFNLESSGTLVKRGAGVWNVYGNEAVTGRFHVAGGTVRFRHMASCDGDQWWRMSVTKQYGGPTPAPAELGLFAGEERINQGLTAVSSTVASSLSAGTVMFPLGSPYVNAGANVARLFDDNNSSVWVWAEGGSSPTITASDSSTWLTAVFRLATAQSAKIATSADVRGSYWASYANGLKVESSPSGADGTWTERGNWTWSGAKGWASGWIYGSEHLAFTNNEREGTDANARGIALGTTIRVDGGATLDTSLVKSSERVVSSIEIDCVAGGGTITDLAFAESGTVNVLGLAADATTLPLTITRPVNSENVRRWKVRMDGLPKNGMHVVFENGTLRLIATGTIVLFK